MASWPPPTTAATHTHSEVLPTASATNTGSKVPASVPVTRIHSEAPPAIILSSPPPQVAIVAQPERSPPISPSWCEGLSLDVMMGALLEDEEVPILLRFGATRIEATPRRPLREPLSPPHQGPPNQDLVSTPVRQNDRGPLGATYEDISDGEVVELSFGDDASRPPAENAILISDEEGTRDEGDRFETPPPTYEELFGPGPYTILDTALSQIAVPSANASTGTPTTGAAILVATSEANPEPPAITIDSSHDTVPEANAVTQPQHLHQGRATTTTLWSSETPGPTDRCLTRPTTQTSPPTPPHPAALQPARTRHPKSRAGSAHPDDFARGEHVAIVPTNTWCSNSYNPQKDPPLQPPLRGARPPGP
ncbi:uncharacterized protein [Drosophila takahashii]|uniref:uncharacterized protein n=1 Tax=Drosophila takahashii TaxID=29030 RepID=UPI0038995780